MDDGLSNNKPFSCYFPQITNQVQHLNHKQILEETKTMASMSMTASILPSSSSSLTRLPSRSTSRGAIVAKASSTVGQTEQASLEMKQESSNGRRDMIFAAAAAAVCTFANVAMGEEEPARGTAEAKKKYAPVCVTMPTARICRK